METKKNITQKANRIGFTLIFIIVFSLSISSILAYSPWYQVNDNYQIVRDDDSDIVSISSSSFSGDMLNSVLQVGDTNDRISSDFIVDQTGEYDIEIVSYTGYLTPSDPYARLDRTNIYIDGELLSKTQGSQAECQEVWNWYYCPFTVSKQLSSGSHTIEIESTNSKLRIDRYRYNLIGSTPPPPPPPVDNSTTISAWYNFEDAYTIDSDSDSDIVIVSSSSFSGEMNGAVLQLGDTNDKISYNFAVGKSADYKIELVSYTAYNNPSNPYERLSRTRVLVDGVELEKIQGDDSLCQTVWNWQYCNYYVFTNLNSGNHKLSIESTNAKLRLDRFRYHLLSSEEFSWNLVQEDTIPIFGYHNIIGDNEVIQNKSLDMHKSDFIDQIDYATNTLNCKWYTIADIVENYINAEKKTPKNACIITFDDGKVNQYENAVPYLNSHNIPATFYVVNSYADGSSGYMNWSQVIEVYNQGHEIGSHNYNHNDLSLISQAQALSEITNSKAQFLQKGINVKTFAYPYGSDNTYIRDMVKDAGFIAGRDTEKDNTFRRQVFSTTNAGNPDFLYNLNYFKPDYIFNYNPLTWKSIMEKEYNYNSWWQFEENYLLDKGSLTLLSSVDPVLTPSYAILRLESGAQITSSFYTYNSGDYKIEVFSSTGQYSTDKLAYMDRPVVYINGIPKDIVPTDDVQNECYEAPSGLSYCSYYVYTTLSKGHHEISLEAKNGQVQADMFRVWEKVSS